MGRTSTVTNLKCTCWTRGTKEMSHATSTTAASPTSASTACVPKTPWRRAERQLKRAYHPPRKRRPEFASRIDRTGLGAFPTRTRAAGYCRRHQLAVLVKFPSHGHLVRQLQLTRDGERWRGWSITSGACSSLRHGWIVGMRAGIVAQLAAKPAAPGAVCVPRHREGRGAHVRLQVQDQR
jgi:hypothetical protein